MTPLSSRSASLPRPIVSLLAALPLLDCVADQVNNTWHPGLGPISLLQMINLPLLLAFAGILLWALLIDARSVRHLPWPVPAALLLLGMACTAELIRTGSLSMASLAPYGQMLYWLLLWAVVALTCRERWQVWLLLRGLVCGALATAVSVYLGFLFGTRQYYGADAVTSSAGWFDTAKMITGILVAGGVLLLYAGKRERPWLHTLLACFCFTAAILTYARAGWVALGGVLVWLLFWAALFAMRSGRRWIVPLLILGSLAAVAVPAAVGPDKLLARWSDVGQGDEAGSGRATFWHIAFEQFVHAPATQQAFGRGYLGMADMLLREYGMDIRHTHNDLLDMLTVFGIPGAVWLLLFLGWLFGSVWRYPLRSATMACAFAVVLTYFLHGQFTGQLWGTDVMSFYTVALACLLSLAREPSEIAAPALLKPSSFAFHLQATR